MSDLKIYPLRSGSSGNATVISDKSTTILVDCGISGRATDESLCDLNFDPNQIVALLVTHEHIDHIKGVGIFSRKHNVPIYANAETWRAMKSYIGKISTENIKVFDNNSKFSIGDIEITPFLTSHDAARSVGYSFENTKNKVCVATDMGEINEEIIKILSGSSAVLLEANYDQNLLEIGPYPYDLKRRIKGRFGHLCNDETGKTAVQLVKSGVNEIILGHLSNENNHPQLAYQTVKDCFAENGIIIGQDVKLSVAKRHSCGVFYPEEQLKKATSV